MPGCGEAAEMIQANDVHVSQQRAQTGDAPAIPGLAKHIPVIYRITPKLPLRAEVVGRYSRNKTWAMLLVQNKELRMRPYVARVGRYEEGEITDQAQSFAAGMNFESLALTE